MAERAAKSGTAFRGSNDPLFELLGEVFSTVEVPFTEGLVVEVVGPRIGKP